MQFTIFHHLLPYSSGRAAAHHNRAGIGPMLVASDRRQHGTGPPRQVHRIRALVCVYYTTIQPYKYKIIQKNISMKMRQWQPSWHGSPQKSTCAISTITKRKQGTRCTWIMRCMVKRQYNYISSTVHYLNRMTKHMQCYHLHHYNIQRHEKLLCHV